MTDDNIIVIDIDLINELKIQGRYVEAKNLLKKFRQNSKKESLQLNKELIKRDRDIAKVKGICTNCLKREVINDYVICEFCLSNRNIKRYTYRQWTEEEINKLIIAYKKNSIYTNRRRAKNIRNIFPNKKQSQISAKILYLRNHGRIEN